MRENLWFVLRLCVKRAVYHTRLEFYDIEILHERMFRGFSAMYFHANRGLMTDLRPCKLDLKSVEEINAEVDWRT